MNLKFKVSIIFHTFSRTLFCFMLFLFVLVYVDPMVRLYIYSVLTTHSDIFPSLEEGYLIDYLLH